MIDEKMNKYLADAAKLIYDELEERQINNGNKIVIAFEILFRVWHSYGLCTDQVIYRLIQNGLLYERMVETFTDEDKERDLE